MLHSDKRYEWRSTIPNGWFWAVISIIAVSHAARNPGFYPSLWVTVAVLLGGLCYLSCYLWRNVVPRYIYWYKDGDGKDTVGNKSHGLSGAMYLKIKCAGWWGQPLRAYFYAADYALYWYVKTKRGNFLVASTGERTADTERFAQLISDDTIRHVMVGGHMTGFQVISRGHQIIYRDAFQAVVCSGIDELCEVITGSPRAFDRRREWWKEVASVQAAGEKMQRDFPHSSVASVDPVKVLHKLLEDLRLMCIALAETKPPIRDHGSPTITLHNLYWRLSRIEQSVTQFAEKRGWVLHPAPTSTPTVALIERFVEREDTAVYTLAQLISFIKGDKRYAAQARTTLVLNELQLLAHRLCAPDSTYHAEVALTKEERERLQVQIREIERELEHRAQERRDRRRRNGDPSLSAPPEPENPVEPISTEGVATPPGTSSDA